MFCFIFNKRKTVNISTSGLNKHETSISSFGHGIYHILKLTTKQFQKQGWDVKKLSKETNKIKMKNA